MSDHIVTRSLSTFEVRNTDDDGMTLEGVAVPWDERFETPGYVERFERGAFSVEPGQALYAEHDHLRQGLPIGVIESLSDEDDGLHLRARISDTPKGREVHQLVRDGALHGLSVGFQPVESRNEDDGTVTHTRANLREVSVVGFPAYQSAQVTDVRSEPDTNSPAEDAGNNHVEESMSDEIQNAVIEVRSSVDDLDRRFAALEQSQHQEAPVALGAEFRSYGDYVRAFARQEESAAGLFRAWTGGTSADSVVQNTWVGDLTRIVEKPRKVLNLFNRAPLPAEGLTLEYAKLDSDTTQVGKQAAEGDTLSFGKVSVTTATASVDTYGGYSSFSRQEIERANVNILDTAFRAMAAKYASATEKAVRDAVSGATPHSTTATAPTDFDGWIAFLVEAAAYLDGKGLTIDGLIVDQSTFGKMAKLKSSDQYLLDRNNGSVDVTGLSASVLGVPVTVIDNGGTDLIEAYSTSAVRTYESAGAPARLGPDNDITNLTGAYSVYGYLAIAVEDESALVIPAAA